MRRTLSLLWLVLQATFAASAPIADARVAHEGPEIHWEADSEHCPPLHDIDDCRLCQAIGTGLGEPAAAVAAPLRVAGNAAVVPTSDLVGAAEPDRGPAKTRAPPEA